MEGIYSKFPSAIMLEVSRVCNLNCEYCYRTKTKNIKSELMDWDNFLNIVGKLNDFKKIIFCGIGEQILHPKFYDMLDYFENKDLVIITNGTIPIQYQKLNNKRNNYYIAFSIDGATEKIAKLNCSKYDFSKLIDNLCESNNFRYIKKGINCVLGPHNIDSVKELYELAKKYNLSALNLHIPTYDKKWVKENSDKIKQIYNDAYEFSKEFGIVTQDYKKMTCTENNAAIPLININGDVRTCCDHYNHIPASIGSVLKNDFNEIWENEKYSKFKEGIYCISCKHYCDDPLQ